MFNSAVTLTIIVHNDIGFILCRMVYYNNLVSNSSTFSM
jgi:hypothetical protein